MSAPTIPTASPESALASMVAAFDLDHVSESARRIAAIGIIDTVGVGVAGSRDQVSEASRQLLEPGSSATWGVGGRLRPVDAAYANAVAAHALDWDDYMHPLYGHCSCILLPTAWAMAEATDASGSALLEAYLAGYELESRIAEIMRLGHYERGWHSTSTVGVLGAAAVAGKLLGLDAAQLHAALGIAASHASGIRENFGTMTKALHAGNAARQGIIAAQLAQRGVSASNDWLLGTFGFARVFGADRVGADAVRTLAASSGRVSAIEGDWGLVLKPYASCGSSHAAVDAVIDTVTRHGIVAADIERIRVEVDPAVAAMLPHHAPSTSLEGRYSMEYTLAIAAIDRAAGAAQFASERIDRPDVRDLMARVDMLDTLTTGPLDKFAAEVTVVTSLGRFTSRVDVASGHPANPMGDEHRAKKFGDAVGPVLGARSDALLALLSDITAVPRWRDVATAASAEDSSGGDDGNRTRAISLGS